ncbi:MAG: PAS domain-containing protein [Rhodospirillaceae bacterium]|nr:PAS domain-containing protein [Rhodospirillaceae bacterium]
MTAIDGTLPILTVAPATGLMSLALVVAIVAGCRLAGIPNWCGYGRLGRVAAGAALGLLLAIGLGLLWLGEVGPVLQPPGLQPWATGPDWLAAAFWAGARPWILAAMLGAPFILALLAALRHDPWLGSAAAPVFALGALALFGTHGLAPAALALVSALALPWLWRRYPAGTTTRGMIRLALLPALPLLAAAPLLDWPGLVLTLAALALFPVVLLGLEHLLGEPVAATPRSSTAARATAVEELKAAPLISRTIADLPEGVAVFDAVDRLIACNATYRYHNPEIAELLEIGARYEDLVRTSVLRGGGDHAAPGSGRDPAAQPVSGGDPEALIAEQMRRHRQLPSRIEVPGPDGRTLLVIESRTADGGTLRLMTDVTAIKGREMRLSELAHRNEVLATAIGAVTSGVVICDATNPDHPVTFANAAFTRITGYAPEEILGRNCRMLQGRDTDPDALDKLRRALAQQRAVNVTLRNYRKDGRTFWNELAISPITDQSGRIVQFVGIMSDVTQRIRAEEHLREAKNQAEFANRSKSEFLANVSHELRTPLNAIIGFSDVMKMELLGPLGTPRYQDYAKDILDSGKLLLSLIEDILDLSKIEAGKMELHPERVSVRDVFDVATTLMRERAKNAGVDLRTEVESELPPLLVDLRAMKQIVVNLASNAVKFTPREGSVELTARRLDQTRAEIVVRDTGIGIARNDLANVLKPFVQVDGAHQRRQSGTGLGLPIVKSLTDLSGGNFHIESELGKGTTVTLHLPLADQNAARSAAE